MGGGHPHRHLLPDGTSRGRRAIVGVYIPVIAKHTLPGRYVRFHRIRWVMQRAFPEYRTSSNCTLRQCRDVTAVWRRYQGLCYTTPSGIWAYDFGACGTATCDHTCTLRTLAVTVSRPSSRCHVKLPIPEPQVYFKYSRSDLGLRGDGLQFLPAAVIREVLERRLLEADGPRAGADQCREVEEEVKQEAHPAESLPLPPSTHPHVAISEDNQRGPLLPLAPV